MHRIQRLVKRNPATSGGKAYLAAPVLFGALVLGLTSGSAYGVAPAAQGCDHHGHCRHHAREAQVKSCEHGEQAHIRGKHAVAELVVDGEQRAVYLVKVGDELLEYQPGKAVKATGDGTHEVHLETVGEADGVHAGKGFVIVGEELGELHVEGHNPLALPHSPHALTITEDGAHGVLLEAIVEPGEKQSGQSITIDDGKPHALHVEGHNPLGVAHSPLILTVTREGAQEVHIGTLVKPREVHSGKGLTIVGEKPDALHVESHGQLGVGHSARPLIVSREDVHEVHLGTLVRPDELHTGKVIRIEKKPKAKKLCTCECHKRPN